MQDVVAMLKMWLEKDEIVARNMGEDGISIKFDIGEAAREITRLRRFEPKDDCSLCCENEE